MTNAGQKGFGHIDEWHVCFTNTAFIPEGGSGGENLVKVAERRGGRMLAGIIKGGKWMVWRQPHLTDDMCACDKHRLNPSQGQAELEGIFCVKVVGRRVE